MTKVLILDEDRSIRWTLATLFESQGHRVWQAADSAGALEALSAEPDIRLVLADDHPTGTSGLRLLESIRLRHPDTLVVLMSAYASIGTAIAAMKAGAFDYLTKPLSIDALQRVSKRGLEARTFPPPSGGTP